MDERGAGGGSVLRPEFSAWLGYETCVVMASMILESGLVSMR